MEKSRRDIARLAFEIAATGEAPHIIAERLEKEVMPAVNGDLTRLVNILSEALNGSEKTGTKPDIWGEIQDIDNVVHGQLGTALTAMAMNIEEIQPPVEKVKPTAPTAQPA